MNQSNIIMYTTEDGLTKIEGLIRFNKDFLELRPDFKDVAVVSYFDTDEGKHKLRIEHNLNANVVICPQ